MQHYNISEATDAASALSDSRSWGCLRLLRSPPRSPSVRSVSKRAHSARHRSSGDIPTPGTTTMPGMGTSTNTGELPSVTITLTVVGIRTGRALIATIMERTAAATRMAARGTVTIMAPETIAAGTARKGIAMAARRTTRVTITAMGMRMARAVMPTASRPRTCSVSRSGRTPRRPARRASPWRTRTDRETRDIPRPWPEARSQLRRDERSQSLVLAARRLPSPAERAGLRGRIRALRGQRGRRRGALALPRPQDGALRLTLHLEPSVARIDEVSGQAGRKLGSENKLIFDRELIPNTLFGAINLLYDVERMKERHNNFVAERAANAGVGAALTFRVTDDLFLGGEARYLRAYEGFGLRKWQGEAVYVGPTLFARFLKNGWISAAWNYQVNGRTATNRANRAEAITEFNGAVAEALAAVAEPPEGEQPAPLQLPSAPAFARRGHKDLVNFERHQLRLKVGFEF